jgi:hypothetical protein
VASRTKTWNTEAAAAGRRHGWGQGKVKKGYDDAKFYVITFQLFAPRHETQAPKRSSHTGCALFFFFLSLQHDGQQKSTFNSNMSRPRHLRPDPRISEREEGVSQRFPNEIASHSRLSAARLQVQEPLKLTSLILPHTGAD